PQPQRHVEPGRFSQNYAKHSKSQTSIFSGLGDMFNGSSKTSNPAAVPSPKHARSRLHFPNPKTLLMRRRSAQPIQPLSNESLVSHLSPSHVPPLPDNYDPSIRGRIVHDFSAPRPPRNGSYSNGAIDTTTSASHDSPINQRTPSPQKMDKEHTPIFREHFDDDTSYEQSQAAIRAEQLANSDFVSRNSWQPSVLPAGPSRTPPPPPLGQKSTQIIGPPASPELLQPTQSVAFDSKVLSPVQEAPDSIDELPEATPKQRKLTKTPPQTRSRTTSIGEASFVPAGLPAHMTSKASRFSFQISGSDAAQEKILEERHIKKAAEKASQQQQRMSTQMLEDDYDVYDADDYDFDDGLEEEIPMVGDDMYDEKPMTSTNPSFVFSSPSPAIIGDAALPNLIIGAETPCDNEGFRSGFAVSEDTQGGMHATGLESGPLRNGLPEAQPAGLGLMSLPEPFLTPTSADGTSAQAIRPSGALPLLDDDLYFDDGLIDEQGDAGATTFDEDVFDDPTGPLYERKVQAPTLEERLSALHSNPPDLSELIEEEHQADDGAVEGKPGPSLVHKNSLAHGASGLRLENLDAYHSALADAAQRAHAEGRFYRQPSVDNTYSSEIDGSSPTMYSHPELVPENGPISEKTVGFSTSDDLLGISSGHLNDYEYGDYDSALEDDPMIAEANAEVLANDYEGFYGQEFNFYANAEGDATHAYGGFFGSSNLGRSTSGRSTSGRNAVREPNLTPITERSEYSTRNSFVSINHFKDGGQPLQSPGLAQLARMSSPYGWPDEDPDMTMDTLRKLRKGAFGSTASSLVGSSGNSPRNSSPMGMQYVPRNASAMGHTISHEHSDAIETDDSDVSDDMYTRDEDPYGFDADDMDDDGAIVRSRPESPTLTASDSNPFSSPPHHIDSTFNTTENYRPNTNPLSQPLTISTHALGGYPQPNPFLIDTESFTPSLTDTHLFTPALISTTFASAPNERRSLGLVSPVSTTSPVTPSGGAWKPSHSRKTSTADSVAYVREQDEHGGDRWVLERRRTAESGELELVGREVVEGGI
ncbi:hypothetical protein M011DRAFT_408015, partial [Sporormia fimetaria CBS 119925]